MKKHRILLILLAIPALFGCDKSKSNSFVALSYNIKIGADYKRLGQLVKIIKSESPDLIGLQEVNKSSFNKLNNTLVGYKGFFKERDNGGEGTAVFYKRTQFKVIDSGYKWISENPDVSSKTEGAYCTRILNYTVLKHKNSKKEFVHINTHIDHNLDIQDVQMNQFESIVKNISDKPMLFTGDFNFEPTSPVYTEWLSKGYEDLSDDSFTFCSGEKIDYFFGTKDKFESNEYKVVRDHKYSPVASDHFAIKAKISFKY